MRQKSQDKSNLKETAVKFYSSFTGSLLICVTIHIFAPHLTSDQSLMRFGLVVVFFGCLASAAWSFTEPYENYLTASMRWRYADAGPAIRRNVERIIARRARYFRELAMIGMTGIGFLGLAVLAEWPQLSGLAAYQNALAWLALLASLAVPGYAFACTRPLRESIKLTRQVNEDMRANGERPRTLEDHARLRAENAAAPVKLLGPMRFRAAGYDWHWSDFYKNAAVFGMSGSGKTICVLNALLDGLIGSSKSGGQGCSGLILDPKGDFRNKVELLCRQHSRSRDLVIIDPANLDLSIRWNPLDSPDDALEVAGRFGAVMQTLSDKSGDDTFWIESSVRLIQNLLSLHRFAEPDAPPSLVDLYEAAMSDEVLREVRVNIPDDTIENNRSARRTVDYFINVWLPMPDQTKGSVRAFVANMLGSFLVEPYDEMFAGRSDVTLSDIVEKGMILYVHMPIADKETMAKVVSTFVKLEFFREVLKRPNKERPSFFLCDEFQSFFTVGEGRGDADAFERTRQSNHANIIAFQNLNSLLKQTPKKEPVMNLLGNCALKFFLRNTDDDTNKYASTLFGKQIENLSSTSTTIGQGVRDRGSGATFSGSDQYQDRIKQEEFATLTVPSREDGVDHAEAIAHLAARSQVNTERLRWKVHPIAGGRRG